jgi:hypothetical protein
VSSPTSRSFRVWYLLLLAVVVVAWMLLDRAIGAGNNAIVMALVFAGLLYVVAAGLVAIIRLLRER